MDILWTFYGHIMDILWAYYALLTFTLKNDLYIYVLNMSRELAFLLKLVFSLISKYS